MFIDVTKFIVVNSILEKFVEFVTKGIDFIFVIFLKDLALASCFLIKSVSKVGSKTDSLFYEFLLRNMVQQ